MILMLKRFWCRLTLHRNGGPIPHGSYMVKRGPRYLYQCAKCGDYYSEPWL
jgi:hypothetical protein